MDGHGIPVSKASQKGRSHTLSQTPTRKVLMPSFLHVLVHHSDSGLGPMSKSNNSSITSFHTDQFLPVVAEQPVDFGPHHPTQRVFIVVLPSEGQAPAFGSPLLLRFPTYRCLHTSLTDAASVPKVSLTVLQTRGPSDVLHLCQQSGRRAAVMCP